MFRVGTSNNPIVFPQNNNFSYSLLEKSNSGYTINHVAIGSDLFRYSVDYGQSWTQWGNFDRITYLEKSAFKKLGIEHVIVDYWCKKCGAVSARVYGDLSATPSIFPKLYVQGEFNMYGLDRAMENQMIKRKDGFSFPFVWNFPTEFSFDIWGDGSIIFGDVDGDHILDRLPPNSQLHSRIKLDNPPQNYVGWTIFIGDDLEFKLKPSGSWIVSMITFLVLLICPTFAALLVIYVFRKLSYAVIENTTGNDSSNEENGKYDFKTRFVNSSLYLKNNSNHKSIIFKPHNVLIATLEYEIPDLKIKVRIGGLGVMSSLIGNHLVDTKLFWVVPMIGGKLI